MVFMFLNGREKIKRRIIVYNVKIIQKSNFSVHKESFTGQLLLFIYVLSMVLLHYSGRDEEAHLAFKPKVFTVWSFIENVCRPLNCVLVLLIIVWWRQLGYAALIGTGLRLPGPGL